MMTAKKTSLLLLMFLLSATLTFNIVAEDHSHNDDDGEVELSELPSGIQSFIKTLPADIEDLEVEDENENGAVTYEVEYEIEDSEFSFELTENGDILEREQTTTLNQLPEEVKNALEKELVGGKVLEAESVEVHYFEFKFIKDGEIQEVMINANGQILSDDDGDHEDDDDDDDK